MSDTTLFPVWGVFLAGVRKCVAAALLGGAGIASAASGYVTFNEAALDNIFSQSSFGQFTIDIRFNPSLSIVADSLLDINSTAEFNGAAPSLSALADTLGVPDFTVSVFFVDKISFCGGPGNNIIGCGSQPGSLIALQSAAAAGANGAALLAHELGHNLGLDHLAGGGNLMNATITGATTLSAAQIGTFLNLSTGASLNPIVQLDPKDDKLYISITPIAVLAAVPEPEAWAMLSLGLLAVAGWARRRQRECAA